MPKTSANVMRMIIMAIIGATIAVAGSQPGETPAAGNSGPGKIDDLGVEQLSPESIRLTWTAPAKTGAGAVSSYEIRTADNLITETTWPKARPVAGTPVPAAPGTPQSLILYKLTPKKRCWFAIKAFDGAKASRISNSAANPPAGLDQVDVFTMACWCLDARTRRLVLALQPDFVERQHMEFFFSTYMDRNYEGVPFRNLLKQRGALLGNGMNYKELFDVADVGATLSGSPCEKRNMDRLMEKSRKLIDLGWEAIEYDLTVMSEGCWKPLSEQLHAYAQSKGQRLFLTGNGTQGPGGGGFGYADYCLYQYPRNWSAPVNYIDVYRATVVRDGQRPAFAFVDCGVSEFDPSPCLPKDKALYPAFYRFNEAQLMAAGIIPGSTRLYLNNSDAYEIGVFFVEMNNAKFLRENRELLHNLSYLKPATLACSKPNIYLSTLGQDGRTLLHLVNGNINIRANAQEKQTDFTVRIALDKAPTRVWMTTPDKLWDARRQNLAHTYENGIAAITIPEIEYHDLVVIEQGNAYDPVYSPMEIVFPFPIRKNIPAGNRMRIHAVQTEGFADTFDWRVGGKGAGKTGDGLAFDGVDDTMSVPPRPYAGVSNTFSIAFWVKPTAERDNGQVRTSQFALGARYLIAPTHGQAFGAERGHAGAGIAVGTNGVSVFEHAANYLPSVLVHDAAIQGWTHVALVYSNSAPTLYLDGVPAKTGPASSKIVHPSFTFGGTHAFKGYLGDVRFYDRALAPATVARLAAGGRKPVMKGAADVFAAGLMGHWRLDETRGRTVADSTAAGNHGIFMNGLICGTELPAGDASVGTVDAYGCYTAPSNAPSPASVVIEARSREAAAIHNGFEIRITSPLALPWTEKFASDSTGAIPADWEIVDGKGDWRIAMDGTEKVLHQFNVFDVIIQQSNAHDKKSVNDLYGYSALIAGGDQNWTRYTFSFKVKYVIAPYILPGQAFQTGRISAVFGYKDGSNYHEYWLVGKEARLFTHVGGKMTEAGKPVACPSPSLNAYTDIKVAVTGADSCLFVNGALVRRDGNPPTSGGIGFGASSTECYFKSIEVANPGVE